MDGTGRSLLPVAGAVLVVALAACGGGTPGGPRTASRQGATSIPGTASASGAGTAGGTAKAASARCTVKELSARLVPGSPGAGQRYADIVLTNRSSRACAVRGFGGMQLLAADGADVPTRLNRDPQPAPQEVLLPPGKSAASLLHWTVIPSADEPQMGPCEPAAARAEVTPPDETHSIVVKWDMGVVCGHGEIEQRAYVSATISG